MKAQTVFSSPLGMLEITEEDGALVSILFVSSSTPPTPPSTPLLSKAKKEMEEYFRGERSSFTLPLSPKGTPFQKKVWEITSTIGYGETKSYGEIAEIMDSKAYRAIGSALGANPLPIVIPCHRVKAKASIGGYSGGLDKKRILLSLEGIED